MQNFTDQLNHGDTVTVTHTAYGAAKTCTATVTKKLTENGKKVFYLQPVNDGHSGAAINATEVITVQVVKHNIVCEWTGRHGDQVKVTGAPDIRAAREAALQFAELPAGIILDEGRAIAWGYEEPQPEDWQDYFLFWSNDEHPVDQREWWEK